MFTHARSTVRVLRMLMHLSACHVTLLPGGISLFLLNLSAIRLRAPGGLRLSFAPNFQIAFMLLFVESRNVFDPVKVAVMGSWPIRRDVVSVETSRSRDILTSRRGLVLVSEQYVSVSAQQVSSWVSGHCVSSRHFVQTRAVHTVAAVRAILTSLTFVAQTYSFTVFLLFHLLIYHKAELCHVSLFSS